MWLRIVFTHCSLRLIPNAPPGAVSRTEPLFYIALNSLLVHNRRPVFVNGNHTSINTLQHDRPLLSAWNLETLLWLKPRCLEGIWSSAKFQPRHEGSENCALMMRSCWDTPVRRCFTPWNKRQCNGVWLQKGWWRTWRAALLLAIWRTGKTFHCHRLKLQDMRL